VIERRAVCETPLRLSIAVLVVIVLVAVLGFIGITTGQRLIEIRTELAVKRCQHQMLATGRPVEDCRHVR